MLAKSFCHFILPPTFRFLSHGLKLPNRRFYTPATDYTSMPVDKGLRPFPSVIDLPGMVEYEMDGVGADAAAASTARGNGLRAYGAAIKQRGGGGRNKQDAAVSESEKHARETDERDAQEWGAATRAEEEQDVKHYDADGACRCASSCDTEKLINSRLGSVDEGVRVLWYWDTRCGRYSGHVLGARLGRQDELSVLAKGGMSTG